MPVTQIRIHFAVCGVADNEYDKAGYDGRNQSGNDMGKDFPECRSPIYAG